MTVIDYLMTYAPPFSESSLVHCPLNAVLDWPMCMPSGYALFRDQAFNAQLKRVLNYWCGFLSGPYSRTHLDAGTDGWFSPEAIEKTRLMEFLCDPNEPYWGFSSWNGFFTRQFKPGARPVAEPDDPKVIVSACEASPYAIRQDVRLHDRFWIKAQPYSLQEIFTASQRKIAERFVGGSVYQAFLSAFNYHRWHAPVSGTITHAYLIDGTYYSDVEAEGEDPGGRRDRVLPIRRIDVLSDLRTGRHRSLRAAAAIRQRYAAGRGQRPLGDSAVRRHRPARRPGRPSRPVSTLFFKNRRTVRPYGRSTSSLRAIRRASPLARRCAA
jgi:hypothetical protein